MVAGSAARQLGGPALEVGERVARRLALGDPVQRAGDGRRAVDAGSALPGGLGGEVDREAHRLGDRARRRRQGDERRSRARRRGAQRGVRQLHLPHAPAAARIRSSRRRGPGERAAQPARGGEHVGSGVRTRSRRRPGAATAPTTVTSVEPGRRRYRSRGTSRPRSARSGRCARASRRSGSASGAGGRRVRSGAAGRTSARQAPVELRYQRGLLAGEEASAAANSSKRTPSTRARAGRAARARGSRRARVGASVATMTSSAPTARAASAAPSRTRCGSSRMQQRVLGAQRLALAAVGDDDRPCHAPRARRASCGRSGTRRRRAAQAGASTALDQRPRHRAHAGRAAGRARRYGARARPSGRRTARSTSAERATVVVGRSTVSPVRADSQCARRGPCRRIDLQREVNPSGRTRSAAALARMTGPLGRALAIAITSHRTRRGSRGVCTGAWLGGSRALEVLEAAVVAVCVVRVCVVWVCAVVFERHLAVKSVRGDHREHAREHDRAGDGPVSWRDAAGPRRGRVPHDALRARPRSDPQTGDRALNANDPAVPTAQVDAAIPFECRGGDTNLLLTPYEKRLIGGRA